jgi:hypothetical protein
MDSFSYVSRDSKDYNSNYSGSGSGNSCDTINIKQKIYEYNPDKRQITIYEYNPNKKYEISIYIFLDILNKIEISKNALDICNSINCNDIDIRQKALDYGLTYKNIFNGDNTSLNARKVLEIIKCDTKPKINIKTFKSICYIKWKIYEINEKQKKKNNYKDEDNISEWIGVLSGLVLYFDELDESNYNTTRYSKDICNPLTVMHI